MNQPETRPRTLVDQFYDLGEWAGNMGYDDEQDPANIGDEAPLMDAREAYRLAHKRGHTSLTEALNATPQAITLREAAALATLQGMIAARYDFPGSELSRFAWDQADSFMAEREERAV